MKNKIKNILGFTLVEILIGVVISSIMMAAMFTSYNVVRNTYSQVTDVAGISRSGRDIISMMMRDIRMAGFKYQYGVLRAVDENDKTKTIQVGDSNIPAQDYLQFVLGDDGQISHAPIVIIKKNLDEQTLDLFDGAKFQESYSNRFTSASTSNIDPDEFCCDTIHIVYGDFDFNDKDQPYKKYRVTYFAQALTRTTGDTYYGVFRAQQGWQQKIGEDSGSWVFDCDACYEPELVREYLDNMEFIAVDKNGTLVAADPVNHPEKLYDIRSVDVRLTFRSGSKKGYFNQKIARIIKGFEAAKTSTITSEYLRDSIFVTVATRNIVGGF